MTYELIYHSDKIERETNMKKHIYTLILSLSLFCIQPAILKYEVSGQSLQETSYISHTSDTEDSYLPGIKDTPDDAELKADTKAEKYSSPKNDESQPRC